MTLSILWPSLSPLRSLMDWFCKWQMQYCFHSLLNHSLFWHYHYRTFMNKITRCSGLPLAWLCYVIFSLFTTKWNQSISWQNKSRAGARRLSWLSRWGAWCVRNANRFLHCNSGCCSELSWHPVDTFELYRIILQWENQPKVKVIYEAIFHAYLERENCLIVHRICCHQILA